MVCITLSFDTILRERQHQGIVSKRLCEQWQKFQAIKSSNHLMYAMTLSAMVVGIALSGGRSQHGGKLNPACFTLLLSTWGKCFNLD